MLIVATKIEDVDIPVLLGAAIFTNLVAWIWFKIARRLWSIQNTALARLYHVECKLKDIYLEYYIKRKEAISIPLSCVQKKKKWESNWKSILIPSEYEPEVNDITGYVRFGTQF